MSSLALQNQDESSDSSRTATKNEQLVWAIRAQELDAVAQLLNEGADPNHEIANATSHHPFDRPLLLATRLRNVALVQLLLTCGADPNGASSQGVVPLATACNHNHVAMVQVLLAAGANPMTCLHDMCKHGRTAMVRLLLDEGKGANVNGINAAGDTPLLAACRKDSEAVVRDTVDLLLQRGAAVNATNQLPHGPRQAPLHSAAFRNDALQLRQLLAAPGVNVDIVTQHGETALYLACEHKCLAAVQVLVHVGGANLHLASCGDGRKGETPLHAACQYIRRRVGSEHRAIVEILLQAGANVHARDDKHGETPLHVTSRRGCWRLAHRLLQQEQEPQSQHDDTDNTSQANATNSQGETPLHLAAKRGYLQTVQVLLPHINPRLADRDGHVPLEVAAAAAASTTNHASIVRALVPATFFAP